MDRDTYYRLQQIKQIFNNSEFKERGIVRKCHMVCSECKAYFRTLQKNLEFPADVSHILDKNTENLEVNNDARGYYDVDYIYQTYHCSNLRYRFGARYGYATKETEMVSCYSADLMVIALMLRKEIKGE